MFTMVISILVLLTEISNCLDLSEIDNTAFGSTLMNAVSLQLNLQGPTDKMASYLTGLKDSIESTSFSEQESQLSECNESLKSLELSKRDYTLDILEAQESMSTYSPIVKYANDQVLLKAKELEKQTSYLGRLKEIASSKESWHSEQLEGLAQDVQDIDNIIDGVSEIQSKDTPSILMKINQFKFALESEITSLNSEIQDSMEIWEKSIASTETIVEKLQIDKQTLESMRDEFKSTIEQSGSTVDHSNAMIAQTSELANSKEEICASLAKKLENDRNNQQSQLVIVNEILNFLENHLDEIKKYAEERKDEHDLGGPRQHKMINVD